MHELAVLLALNVDHTPAVFASTNGLSVDDNVALRTDDSERNHALQKTVKTRQYLQAQKK